MKKKYNFSILIFLLTIGLIYSQEVTFNVDLNGSSYPTSSSHIMRITANPNGEGWNGSFVTLTDDNNDGIYSGTASNVATGELLFQVRQGDPGSTSWGNEILPSGCDTSEFEGANYKTTITGNKTLSFDIGECLTTTTVTTTEVTFNVDLNGTSYPAAGNDIRIGGNIAGTGWSPDLVTLSDANNDGIYSGTISDVASGTLLFRVWQGALGVAGWSSGDWISDITANGCSLSEVLDANYKLEVVSGTSSTISFKLNDCLSAPTLGNISFNIDFNGKSFPSSENHIIRIAANPNLTGWNGNFIPLSDTDDDGIFSGVAYGVEPGEILFQVLEGEPTSTAWGDPISDPVGCDMSSFEGGNYKSNISIGETTNLNFSLDSCLAKKSLSVQTIKPFNAKVYPNPTTDMLNIETSFKLKSIAVYNILGSKVLSNTSGDRNISLGKLKSGIYSVHLSFEKGNSQTIKVIKQ